MDELLEKLAELEHKQWQRFARAVISEVAPQRQSRWKKYFIPYDKMDDKAKNLDREQAKRVMEIVDEFYCKISKD
jgi:hypothetical protein